MAMFETLVQLFAAFAKIGFTSFGGTSMIPLIMDEMSSHGWMTDADLTNLIAIAEMTPGSLGVKAATFAGTKTAGLPGGVFADLGVLSPTLPLTLLAAAFFQKFRTSKVMSYIMKIVKPVCIGMVLGVPVMSLIYVILREKTLPEGEIPPSPLQMPEKTAMEQRANEWFGKMRDTVFTTVTDTVKRNWQHHEEDDDSATEEPTEKDMKSAESTVSETPISVILEQTDEEGCEIHPAASESESTDSDSPEQPPEQNP